MPLSYMLCHFSKAGDELDAARYVGVQGLRDMHSHARRVSRQVGPQGGVVLVSISYGQHQNWWVCDPCVLSCPESYLQVVGSGAATSYMHLPCGMETVQLDTAIKILRMTITSIDCATSHDDMHPLGL